MQPLMLQNTTDLDLPTYQIAWSCVYVMLMGPPIQHALHEDYIDLVSADIGSHCDIAFRRIATRQSPA